MSYQIFSVVQSPTWACPGILIFVQDGLIIGQQSNPNNALTQEWADDNWGVFDQSQYRSVVQLR